MLSIAEETGFSRCSMEVADALGRPPRYARISTALSAAAQEKESVQYYVAGLRLCIWLREPQPSHFIVRDEIVIQSIGQGLIRRIIETDGYLLPRYLSSAFP